MKYFYLLCLVVCFYVPSSAQKNKKAIALYTSILNVGLPSQGENYGEPRELSAVMLGAEYIHPIKSWLKITGGLEFTDHYVEVYHYGILRDVSARDHIQLLSVPVVLRVDVLRYIFFTFGTIIDIQLHNTVSDHKIEGIGITGGTGLKYDFKKTGLFIHPYYQAHAPHNDTRFFNLGIRLGMSYRF